jgi:predicted TIM-barrel fold metal-dependent hydrolase
VALAKRLDRAMAKLFDTCIEEDASVIAHANRSNDAGPDYSQRADPAHWIPVFRRWPRLRVCLAHFGHFSEVSAATPAGTQLPEASWEWALGRYIKQAGDPPVFADVSYLTEVSGAEPASLEAYAAVLRRWMSEFDPECRHLMFGTDWTMLGLDRSYEDYTARLYAFFRDEMKFDRSRLNRLLFGNAGRFLGLRQDDKARARLLDFYARNKLSPSRLPLIAAA